MNVRQHDRGRPPSSTTWSLGRKEGWRDFVDADRRDVDTDTVFNHGIASAHAMCPSKPRDVAMLR
jgi:hypothetical protein